MSQGLENAIKSTQDLRSPHVEAAGFLPLYPVLFTLEPTLGFHSLHNYVYIKQKHNKFFKKFKRFLLRFQSKWSIVKERFPIARLGQTNFQALEDRLSPCEYALYSPAEGLTKSLAP